MNPKQSLLQISLRVIGFALGLISILSGMAAWSYSHSREPERYLVSALVMILGGVLWLLYSTIPKYQLSKKHSILILTTLFLGLTLGLFYTFSSCGGECGLGASFCRWEYGYPGRWLRTGGCYGPLDTTQVISSNWKIDSPSFVADVVFWSGTGLIISFLWNAIYLKASTAVTKN